MGRISTKALLIAGLAIAGLTFSASAQHGGGHGGFSSHGGGSHGSFAGGFQGHAASGGYAATPNRGPATFRSGAPFPGGNRFGSVTRYGYPGQARLRHSPQSFAYGQGQLSSASGDRFRRPYRRPYGGYPYGGRIPYGSALWVSPYPGPYAEGWLDPLFYDYSDDDHGYGAVPAYGYNEPNQVDPGPYGDSGVYADQSAEGYYEQRPPRQSFGGFASPDRGSADLSNQEAVTLVYKDGRPSEQIHNYILSRTQLTVLDGHARNIAVDEIDMAATDRVNRGSGIRFRLPIASN